MKMLLPGLQGDYMEVSGNYFGRVVEAILVSRVTTRRPEKYCLLRNSKC